jgi:hypothetical protein
MTANSDKRLVIRFICNVLLIFIVLVVFDQLAGRVLRHLYFRQKSGVYYRATYSIDSTVADVIVFGSSRANHHYVPSVFEDSLKLTFYNSGRDGNFLLYNYAVFKAVTLRHKPRLIIFDISPGDLAKDDNSYLRLSSLLPYCRTHPEIRKVALLRGPYEELKQISEIYPFNSMLLTVIEGNIKKENAYEIMQKGYVPLSGVMNNQENAEITWSGTKFSDNNVMNAIKDIVQICEMHNIKLVFINSPYYRSEKSEEFDLLMESYTKDEGIRYFNYSMNSFFQSNPELFQDNQHLNHKGAVIFSQMICKELNGNF